MTKKYKVLMSEIHSVLYLVEAKNEDEAKKKGFDEWDKEAFKK